METDLILSKKEQILNFIRVRHYCRTSDVIKFGLSIYTTRGDRYARDLAREGRIRRMDEWNKKMLFKDIREEIWEWIEKS